MYGFVALTSPRGGARLFQIAHLEVEIARINEHAKALSENKHRVADIERVGEQEKPAADGEEPERDRHHHLAGALGGDPLHHEAHGEHDLREITEQHPPLELLDEHFVEVLAKLVRQFNEHGASPPSPAALFFDAGSATTRRTGRECRPTA